jgi:hypothetical protein
MNVTLLKALVALVPACIRFSSSVVLSLEGRLCPLSCSYSELDAL